MEYADRFGRTISYLRVSVTDRCNLRCWYCMPEDANWLSKDDILTYEELLQVITVASELGISKIRLTGGEPLLRKGLPSFISKLNEIPGIREITLTTNGIPLTQHAAELKAARLSRVNISIDSLDSARYESLTRGGRLSDVIAGIDAALAAGLHSLKLNAVLHRDAEIEDIQALIEFAKSKDAKMRFIELMPLLDLESRPGGSWNDLFISADEIKSRLAGQDLGHVEFISPVSRPFCDTCNRLRLTADGKLLACLCRGGAVDVKPFMRPCTIYHGIKQSFDRCLALKPEPWNAWGENTHVSRVSAIGG